MKKLYENKIPICLDANEWKALRQLSRIRGVSPSDVVGQLLAREYAIYDPCYINRNSKRLNGCYYDIVNLLMIASYYTDFRRKAEVRKLLNAIANAERTADTEKELAEIKFFKKKTLSMILDRQGAPDNAENT